MLQRLRRQSRVLSILYRSGVQSRVDVPSRTQQGVISPGGSTEARCINCLQIQHPVCRPPSRVACESQPCQDIQKQHAAQPPPVCGNAPGTAAPPAQRVDLHWNLLHSGGDSSQVNGCKCACDAATRVPASIAHLRHMRELPQSSLSDWVRATCRACPAASAPLPPSACPSRTC